MALSRSCLVSNGCIQGIQLILCQAAVYCYVAICRCISILRFAVSAVTHQINERVLKFFIIRQQCVVGLLFLGCDKRLIRCKLLIQRSFFRLDFLHQPGHCAVICRNDMRQRQAVNIHHRPPYLLQLGLADHIFLHNRLCAGMDIVNTEYCENIGQHSHQPQQNDGQDQALL